MKVVICALKNLSRLVVTAAFGPFPRSSVIAIKLSPGVGFVAACEFGSGLETSASPGNDATPAGRRRARGHDRVNRPEGAKTTAYHHHELRRVNHHCDGRKGQSNLPENLWLPPASRC